MQADRQVLAALEREWQGLVEVADTHVATWSRAIPALWGVQTLDDVVLCCAGDAACLALIRRARQGETLAGRVILQAMLEPLSTAQLPHSVTWSEAVTTAWLRIVDTPVSEWPADPRTDDRDEGSRPGAGSVMSSLVRATVRSLWRDPRHGSRIRLPASLPMADDAPADLECVRVLTEALSLGLLEPADALMLHDVYMEGLSVEAVARAQQRSGQTVRRRCNSSLSVLRRHKALLAAA